MAGLSSRNEILPGQYFDEETGLHQNWNRDYDPSIGRYLQSDPKGLDGGSLSTYAYVDSNPLNSIDPDGTVIWLIKLCGKGWQKVRKLSNKEAVEKAREGKAQLLADQGKSEAKQLSKKASKGEKPVHDQGGHAPYNNPHYHPGPHPGKGGHIFYSIAASLTLTHYFEDCGCTAAEVAPIIDLFNPLSILADFATPPEGQE